MFIDVLLHVIIYPRSKWIDLYDVADQIMSHYRSIGTLKSI
jgi:hypothetical protein